jgi:multicomponent Na+:H+ antiporter subunit E
MNPFLLSLLLAFLWATITADYGALNLLTGFLLGNLSLLLVRRRFRGGAFRRGFKLLQLAGYFVLELVLSSLRVSRDVLSPRLRFRPAIVALPLDARRDVEIFLLANLVSLTPGTLSIDVSRDRTVLYVHTMHGEEAEAMVRDVKERFERLILEALA